MLPFCFGQVQILDVDANRLGASRLRTLVALLIVVMSPHSLCGGAIKKVLADKFAILPFQQLPLLNNRLLEFVVQSERYYIVIGIAKVRGIAKSLVSPQPHSAILVTILHRVSGLRRFLGSRLSSCLSHPQPHAS